MATTPTPPTENVYTALLGFQSKMPAITKNKTNPHYRSSYADLGGIMATIQPGLTAYGLVWTCTPGIDDQGRPLVVGTLHHAVSDTRITATIPLVGATDMQKMGSAMTYARRYLVSAVLGIVTEDDDDGNAVRAGGGYQ